MFTNCLNGIISDDMDFCFDKKCNKKLLTFQRCLRRMLHYLHDHVSPNSNWLLRFRVNVSR